MTTHKDSGGAFAMPADRTMQVPVSLIERCADVRADLATMARQERTPDHWAIGRNQRTARSALTALDELLALLSQPIPTAEPDCNCGFGGVHDPDNPRCDRNGYQWDEPAAEPPRIEDMAPGTTFTGKFIPGGERRTFQRTAGSWPVRTLETRISYRVEDIDPSTIRDATPPTEGTK